MEHIGTNEVKLGQNMQQGKNKHERLTLEH
jgi:hypothetical protein